MPTSGRNARVTGDGRRTVPSVWVCCRPRMLPVSPATVMIAPAETLVGTVGMTALSEDRVMRVRAPWHSWPMQRRELARLQRPTHEDDALCV